MTDQELRNSIYRGAFNDALKDAASHPNFHELLGGQLVKRMGDADLVLRFLALADRLTAYKPPLRQFLNEYMRDHRTDGDAVSELLDAFKATADAVHAVFGAEAFRRFTQEGAAAKPINKALFDATMLSFYFADADQIRDRSDEVRRALAELLNEDDFEALIGRATADRTRMFGRIEAFSRKLEELGIETRYREALPQERE